MQELLSWWSESAARASSSSACLNALWSTFPGRRRCPQVQKSIVLCYQLAKSPSSPLSVCQMHQHTHDFPLPTGNVVEARWGTIASAIPEVLRVEKALRYGWDINKWGRVDPDLNSEAYRGVRVDLVDKVVVDPFWWGMLATLSFVAKLLDSFLFFTESCMCHAELIHRFGPAMKTGGPKLRKVLVVPHLSMEAVCLCLFLLKQK